MMISDNIHDVCTGNIFSGNFFKNLRWNRICNNSFIYDGSHVVLIIYLIEEMVPIMTIYLSWF